MNNWIGSGRLCADPECRYTNSGMCVARFRLAVDRNTEEKKKETSDADFISCTAFDKTAEHIEKYLVKGRKILVQGRIKTGNYVDKETNKTVYTTEIIVNRFEFMDKNPKAEPDETDKQAQMQIPEGFSQIDEDIPF